MMLSGLSKAQKLLDLPVDSAGRSRQQVYRADKDKLRELQICISGRTASWERYGDGRAELSVMTWAPGAGHSVSLTILEVGTKSSRETSIALPDASARILFALLAERYAPEMVEAQPGSAV